MTTQLIDTRLRDQMGASRCGRRVGHSCATVAVLSQVGKMTIVPFVKIAKIMKVNWVQIPVTSKIGFL